MKYDSVFMLKKACSPSPRIGRGGWGGEGPCLQTAHRTTVLYLSITVILIEDKKTNKNIIYNMN